MFGTFGSVLLILTVITSKQKELTESSLNIILPSSIGHVRSFLCALTLLQRIQPICYSYLQSIDVERLLHALTYSLWSQ